MLTTVFKVWAKLPLRSVHFLGLILGWGLFFSSYKYRKRVREHLQIAFPNEEPAQLKSLLQASIAESGKGILETFSIWFSPQRRLLGWVKACHGWSHVEKALQKGNGVIFLTPHLGCFEITSLYYGSRHPITALYRPPRMPALNALIEAGRQRDGVTLAPANMRGVRALIKALKRGEAIGILPDQVPEPNEGAWTSFFGRPAYTMTLVGKLQQSTNATILIAYGERLANGEGYQIHIQPFEAEPTPLHINQAIEDMIRRCPSQYLWSYRRYKKP